VSWAVGFDEHWQRDVGYGVPAICDSPRCKAAIDRGLAYVCGGDVNGGEKGCGLYFCYKHLFFNGGGGPQQCSRCIDGKKPYKPKPDTAEWIEHKATDPSWEQWREESEAKP
jgi:hypothetical protein